MRLGVGGGGEREGVDGRWGGWLAERGVAGIGCRSVARAEVWAGAEVWTWLTSMGLHTGMGLDEYGHEHQYRHGGRYGLGERYGHGQGRGAGLRSRVRSVLCRAIPCPEKGRDQLPEPLICCSHQARAEPCSSSVAGQPSPTAAGGLRQRNSILSCQIPSTQVSHVIYQHDYTTRAEQVRASPAHQQACTLKFRVTQP